MNQVKREEGLALLGTSMAHLLSHAFIVSFPAILPFLTRDFSEAGILTGVLFITYGLTTFPSGWLSDKIGERLVLIVYLAVSGFGSVAMILINSFKWLLPIAGAIGLAGGLYHPVGLSLISKVFKEKRGQAMGIHGVAGNVGLAAAPTIAATVAASFRWNLAILPLGCVAFFVSMLFLVSRSWFGNAKAANPAEKISPVARTDKSPKISRYLGFVLIISAFNGIAFNGVISFVNQYLVYNRGFTEVQAGYAASLIYAVGIVSQLVFGYLVDKRGAYLMVGVSFSLIFVTVLLVPFLHGKALFLLFPFLGFALVSTQPGLNTMVAEASAEEKRGMAYGLNFFCNYGIGGIATPFVGILADAFTPDYIFFVLAGFSIPALLVLGVLIPRTSPKKAVTG